MDKSNKTEEKPKVRHKKFKSNKGIATNFIQGFETPKKWYEELVEDPTDFAKLTDTQFIELKDEAKKCNDAEVATYNIRNSKTNSDYQWMKTVMSKGTVSDKIAAFTILIQDDPICNLTTIRNLVNMVKVGKKKECLAVIDTLSELFISDLLIPYRKLKPFHERPLAKLDEFSSGNAGTRRKYLSIWYFEDQLKEYYTLFVMALNTAAHDSVDANKEKAISAMYKLLVGNSEQEKNLLVHIVNKLGDPSQKVASKAIYCLGQLLHAHPAMKQVVLSELEKLLFRSNVSNKAQYYGICFLTQFYLSHEDSELAENLIALYFSFFKACTKKGEINSRMMSALLMGVNRAYPYARTELAKITEHIDTLYKVVHIAAFNVSLHTLNLLYQVSDHNNVINDRFYTALYKKLLDANVATTTHQALFLNLVFRALKKDKNVNRIRAFIKRLLQVALYMQPAMACGILFLVFHVIYKKPNLLAISLKSELLGKDDKPEHYTDEKLDEDLQNNDETQIVLDDAKNKENVTNRNQDIEEDKKTAVDLTSFDEDVKPDLEALNASINLTGSSWVHVDKVIKTEFTHAPVTWYNARTRNPLYAGAEFCVYLELMNLQKHFHPSVALFASKIIKGENISYSGDPLQDFTLIKFLERFSFKNPKKQDDLNKPGIDPVFGKRKLYVPKGVKALAVISPNYLTASVDKIPVEEMFMYKYLQKKNENRPIKEEEDDEDDVDSVASDEFDEYVNKISGKQFEDDDLDFMNDVGDSLKNKKDENDSEDFEEDEDDDLLDEDDDLLDEDDDMLNENNDFEGENINELVENEGFEDGPDDDDDGDEGLMEDFDDEDDSDIEFNDSDEEEHISKKNKSKKSFKKGNKGNDINTLFASADEFASILEEEPDFMAGTSQAVSNKDKAHKKQLSWEQNRQRWVEGLDKACGKQHKKKFPGNKRSANKKRKQQTDHGNKNKKHKR